MEGVFLNNDICYRGICYVTCMYNAYKYTLE